MEGVPSKMGKVVVPMWIDVLGRWIAAPSARNDGGGVWIATSGVSENYAAINSVLIGLMPASFSGCC